MLLPLLLPLLLLLLLPPPHLSRAAPPRTKSLSKSLSPSQSTLLRVFSGGLAGTVSSTLTSPLEVVKTQLQSSAGAARSPAEVARAILKADGAAGFWRGLPPTLVGIIPARSIYFYSYESSKTFLADRLAVTGTANALAAGLCAGVAANTATNPIWMVKTRMQLLQSAGSARYAGYGDAVRTIFREEGVGGFYRGVTASYWGASEGMIQFVAYERIKAALRARNGGREGTKRELFLAAGASKALATVATYPHEVARTRMREFARGGAFKYEGMFQTLGVIAREEGARGLYAGMGTHVARVVPNSAVMFCVYEIVKEWIDDNQSS